MDRVVVRVGGSEGGIGMSVNVDGVCSTGCRMN